MTTIDPGSSAPALRRKRHELEGLILETGRQMIAEQGLGSAAEHLTFKAAFDQLEREQGVRVTNASVIGRIWENQEEFQRAVLRSLVADGPPDLTAANRCVSEYLAHADLSSVEARRHATIELCRVVGAVVAEAMRNSTQWGTWIALVSLHGANATEKSDPQIATLLQASADKTAERVALLVSSALAALGLGFSTGTDLPVLTSAIMSLAQGTFLHDGARTSSIPGVPLPTGTMGTIEDWTVLGIGILALIDQCCVSTEDAGATSPSTDRHRSPA